MNFTFNNIHCTKYNLHGKESSHLSLPEKNYESIKIPGRSDNLIIDNGDYLNEDINVTCILDNRKNKKSINKIRDGIKVWLQGDIGYKSLVFDDGCEYEAIVKKINIIKTNYNIYEVEILFESKEVV